MKSLFLMLLSIFIFSQHSFANEKENLQKHFLQKIDEVIVIVKNTNNTKEIRNSKIVKTLTPMFDFELMAKLSLGKIWKTLSYEEKEKFINLYVERMKESYSSKIDSYSDEKIEIVNIVQSKYNRIVIKTNLVSKEDKLEVSYKFYKPKKQKIDKNKWLIYDVVILGVSILKADKVQFREFLQTRTISELMSQIAKK